MELYLKASDLKLLIGTTQKDGFEPKEHTVLLSAALPEGWHHQETAAVTLFAEADHQIEVRLEFCAADADAPLLSFHYRILPGCRVQVPFPINSRALAADMAFLPPYPGVFKGGVAGRPIQPHEVQSFRILLREPTLRFASVSSVAFVNGWKPQNTEGQALVDELGQCAKGNWPGKTKDLEELTVYLKQQLQWAASHNHYPEGWSRYGGWLQKRFDKTGWFHRVHDGRRWWLVDPDGYAFFSNGMCYGNRTGIYGMADHLDSLHQWLPQKTGLFSKAWTTGDQIPQYVVRNGLANAKDRELVNFPRANMMRVFGDNWLDAWITINTARMRSWGINTLGIGVNDYGDEPTMEFLRKAQMPYVITFKFFPLTDERIFRDFPDVFSPEYERLTAEMAQRELRSFRDDPLLIGYFVTNEPEWLMHENVNLAERLLAADGCRASKQAFADHLRKQYGTTEKLNDAWATDFSSFDDLLAPLCRSNWTEAAQKDLDVFHNVLVERYGHVISDALRAEDPHHLNLGMRYCCASEKTLCGPLNYFDVFSFNCYGSEPASSAARMAKGANMPMIVGEWHIGAKESGLDSWGLYYTDTQAQRADALQYYLEQSTQEPHLTGIHYFEYSDQPYLGRFDGECYQIGLIDVCNRPYSLAAAAFRSFATRMYPLLDGQEMPQAHPVDLKTKDAVE